MARWVVVLGALLVTAGCISGGGVTSPAKSELGTARDTAGDWVDDPELVGVFGVEPPHHIVEDEGELVIHADDTPGDGNAPGWGYVFVGDQGAVGVLVISGLGVLAEFYSEDAEELDAGDPITDWEIDSPRAASILGAHDDWPERADDHTVFWGLAMEDGRPVWHVAIEDVDGTDTIYGDVDASDGEILRVERSEGGFLGGGFEQRGATSPVGEGGCDASSAQGQVTPLGGLETGATLGGPGSISVQFSYAGGGLIRISVELDGSEMYGEDVPPTAGGFHAFELSDMPPGDYVVRASTGSIAAANGQLAVSTMWGVPPPDCFEQRGAGAPDLLDVLASPV